MPKEHNRPVDGYSREKYQDGLDKIEAVSRHPLADELAQHRKWRAEAGTSPYPLVEEEQRAMEVVEKDTQVPHGNIETVESDLKRLFANAHSEANEEYIAREVLPKIEQMKKETENTLRNMDGVPSTALALGREIIADAETAKRIVKQRTHAPLGKVILEIFQRIAEAFRRFKELVSSFFAPNRYGKDKGLHTEK